MLCYFLYHHSCCKICCKYGVGVVPLGLNVPKNPVFIQVSGLGTFRATVFATLLQHVARKKCFATDEIVPGGLQVKQNFAHFLRLLPRIEAVAFFRILAIFYYS